MIEQEIELLDQKTIKLQQDSTSLLHGHTLWDAGLVASRVLERMITQEPEKLKDARVMEIGCGIGLCSLVLYNNIDSIGLSKLTVTDGVEECLELARANFTANFPTSAIDFRLEFHRLSVTEPETTQQFRENVDFLILSDLLYDKSLYKGLVETLAYIRPKSILLVYEKRNFEQELEFFNEFSKTFVISNVGEDHPLADPQYFSEDIYVFFCRLKQV